MRSFLKQQSVIEPKQPRGRGESGRRPWPRKRAVEKAVVRYRSPGVRRVYERANKDVSARLFRPFYYTTS